MNSGLHPVAALLGIVLSPWIALADATAAPAAQADEKIVFDFVGTYCLECHDADVQKGDRDFESFKIPLETLPEVVTAHDIIDQVALKEMPPRKADQPTDQERAELVAALRRSFASARAVVGSAAPRTVMRRLSNREYENTLRTLFGRRIDTLGLTADFPKENTSKHLDTIGESLVTSGFLLDQYFQAAHRLVESRLGRPATKPKSWHFTDHFLQYEELGGSHKSVFNYEFLCLYEQPNTDTRQGGYGHIEDFLEGVPVSGLYDIEVLAQALHRDTHYDPEIFKIDLSEPFQLAVVPGDVTKGHIHYPQAIEPILAQTTVPDDKPEWLSFRVWLEKGQTPRFIFPNGPYESRAIVLTLNKRYQDELKDKDKPFKVSVGRSHLLRKGALPHIRIDEIKIDGPLPEKGGGLEELAVFGKDGFQADRALEQLHAFGERAFRRPLTGADRARIDKAYRQRIEEKATPRQAALDTLKMILCSPSFIYLSEITDREKTLLGAYDLASRLSYALWAAPPDEELRAAAASGALLKPAELTKQAERLLADARAEGFVNGFLDSWLNLRELGQMPPPRTAARVYYYEDLPTSMKAEARLFFRHLISENRPATDFLDANFTFVDKRLAHLYDLPQKETLRLADGFQKVGLEGNPQRGGVLGMAGVLTVSANGVETSPVTRGIWVLENILGIEAPPPPNAVPDIEPDLRGATTIRERLEKHRADKACIGCHRRIDPLGFGLESFDPIGRWRDHYPKAKGQKTGSKIDTTGEFLSGESFSKFDEFRDLLATTRKDLFTRNLVSKLLAYSTGRHMDPVDQFEIYDILDRAEEDNYGMRTLIIEAIGSKIFRSR